MIIQDPENNNGNFNMLWVLLFVIAVVILMLVGVNV